MNGMNKLNLKLLAFFLMMVATAAAQQNPAMVVKVNEVKADIQPTMWGIFFEDINLGADGGVYAELVKNRSFEFYTPLMGWKEQKQRGARDAIRILNRAAQENNPRYARVIVQSASGYGLSNEGFRGMGIKQGNQYHFSLMARVQEGTGMKLRIELVNANNQKIAEATLPISGGEWKKHTVSFAATATEQKAKLNIWFEGTGVLDVDMISLFPQDTWKNRAGGLRADLVQLLADMKPGFLRFPGGCIVEGRELATRYQWKKTIGDINDRQLIVNRWNTEFKHRATPDYFQSFGLGFYEYFLLAEDIGASPLPILNCGMACQYNTSELVPLEELDPYIQDALDLIEFANGGTDTKWGKVRAGLGHPQPFNLKLLGVGNEQWGEQYIERYKVFAKAIKEKYPDVKLITSVGPNPDGELFNYLNPTLRNLKADILDEHYYRAPDWFLQSAKRYDNYDRNGPKIFAGEYAAHSKGDASGEKRSTWQCALAVAAFMTGLERNADVVHMASYAPLFSHTEGWQWAPDLIWFDNLRSYGTPDYYVQKLFSLNKGSQVVPILLNNEALTGQNGLYASAVIDKSTHEVIIKLVNTTAEPVTKDITIEGVKKLNRTATLTVLKSEIEKVNSLDNPVAVSPVDQQMPIKGKKINMVAAPYSFTVLRLKML
jgi:alpha-L-arabinofuranosidase